MQPMPWERKDLQEILRLKGLKENVIVGRLVPAGTGSVKVTWNKKANDDDKAFITEKNNKETAENQPSNQ